MPSFALNYTTPFFGADPDRLVKVARQAEESGFEAIYVPEHVAIYPGAQIGAWQVPTDLPFPDPLDVLTFVAASTERLLLGTGVLLLPYHHPVTLAKRLATIDVLSGGRMRLLGIGVGALPGAHGAMNARMMSSGRMSSGTKCSTENNNTATGRLQSIASRTSGWSSTTPGSRRSASAACAVAFSASKARACAMTTGSMSM